jgi:hypothetical protein
MRWYDYQIGSNSVGNGMGRMCIQQQFSILRLCINTTTVAAFQLPGTAAHGRLVYKLFEKLHISYRLREPEKNIVHL